MLYQIIESVGSNPRGSTKLRISNKIAKRADALKAKSRVKPNPTGRGNRKEFSDYRVSECSSIALYQLSGFVSLTVLN